MSDELKCLARTLREHSADLSAARDYVSELLSTAVSAAAARALAATAGQNSELILQAVVFTMEREVENPTGAIRAHAYPPADPLRASLDLAVQGITSVDIAVEVFDGNTAPVATATVQYSLRAPTLSP